jgi:DNA topoisomerase-1
MTEAVAQLQDLYADTKTCAKLVGLSYVENNTIGYTRLKHGKGFRYLTSTNQMLADKELKQRISELVIPPAWQEVWICPDGKGHILATGVDEKGRKQYIYHPKWRTMRDLIKFYRMIIFAKALPKIRQSIETNLGMPELSRDKVLASMLWLLDNTYIRVGNEQYYQQNESVGLTTLTDKNVVIAGSVTTLSFHAKSGKDQQITFDDMRIARILSALQAQRGERLFRYRDDAGYHEIESSDINTHLYGTTGVHVSAKDFRTWGGTLMAFNHLVETEKLPEAKTPKPEKVLVQAVDAAANVLGNTRSVARSSYVHPDILNVYGTKDFHRYYEEARKRRSLRGLDKRETELVSFLERLFETEFNLLKNQN